MKDNARAWPGQSRPGVQPEAKPSGGQLSRESVHGERKCEFRSSSIQSTLSFGKTMIEKILGKGCSYAGVRVSNQGRRPSTSAESQVSSPPSQSTGPAPGGGRWVRVMVMVRVMTGLGYKEGIEWHRHREKGNQSFCRKLHQ